MRNENSYTNVAGEAVNKEVGFALCSREHGGLTAVQMGYWGLAARPGIAGGGKWEILLEMRGEMG